MSADYASGLLTRFSRKSTVSPCRRRSICPNFSFPFLISCLTGGPRLLNVSLMPGSLVGQDYFSLQQAIVKWSTPMGTVRRRRRKTRTRGCHGVGLGNIEIDSAPKLAKTRQSIEMSLSWKTKLINQKGSSRFSDCSVATFSSLWFFGGYWSH